MSDPKAQTVTLTTDQLEQMLIRMAKEIRKPADPTAEEAAAIESDKAMRRETALLQLEKMKRREAEQAACSHRRRDRTTTCTYEYMLGCLVCQQCQAFIRPEPRLTGELGKEFAHHIYDTRLFNEHFAETQQGITTF